LVVYAQLDWNRVAESMAKDGYRCAEYYISVAPVKYGTRPVRRHCEGAAECRWEVDGASFSEAWASIARSS
jgi:hypothetical protein